MLSETLKRFVFTDPVNSPSAMQPKKLDIDWHGYKQNSQESSDLMRSNSKHWLTKDVNCKTFWSLFPHLANSHTTFLPASLFFAFVSSLLSPWMSQILNLLSMWPREISSAFPQTWENVLHIWAKADLRQQLITLSSKTRHNLFMVCIFFIFRATGWSVPPLSMQCSIRRQIKSVWGSLGFLTRPVWSVASCTTDSFVLSPPENPRANL